MRILTALPLALVIAVPGHAGSDAKPAGGTTSAPDKLICRSEARTGTRFERKVCRTRAEWAALAESAQRDAHEMVDAPKINNTSEH